MTTFKSIGKNLQEVDQIKKREENSLSSENLPVGIKMPLERGSKSYESLFKMNTDVIKQISNNYKTFLLTRKGELLCKPDFGTTISDIYNRTDLNNDQIEEIVMNDISDSTRKYFPFISLVDFESKEIASNSKENANFTKVSIRYTITGFEENINSLELTIRRSL